MNRTFMIIIIFLKNFLSLDDESPVATMSPNVSPQGSNLPSPTGMSGLQENQPNPAGTIGEDRKLPRPIGMERAQRKNPVFGGVSEGIWSYSSSGRCKYFLVLCVPLLLSFTLWLSFSDLPDLFYSLFALQPFFFKKKKTLVYISVTSLCPTKKSAF